MPALLLTSILFLADLRGEQAVFWYRELAAEAGYGWLERERAAFLIREPDGGLTLAMWQEGAHRRASFRGRIPRGTIAVLHTHPRDQAGPSLQDRAEAKRIGLPVVVITPEGVVAAMPEGSVQRLASLSW